jgi:hypothetical protein
MPTHFLGFYRHHNQDDDDLTSSPLAAAKEATTEFHSIVHLFALAVCYALCPQESSAFLATFLSPYRSQIQRLPLQLHLSEKVSEGIGVGIDLGTTYSAVAYMKDGIPTIISVPHNGRTMPSVVSLDQSNQVWVGQQACEHELELGAYRNVKRVLGTGGKLARAIAKVVPYLRVNQDGKTYKKDNLLNQIHDAENFPTLLQSSLDSSATIPPEVISAHIVRTLKAAAEAETGEVVTRAVIGVPAYFQDAQRQATVKAANLAGISQVKLLREPEAAAMAYGLGKPIGRGGRPGGSGILASGLHMQRATNNGVSTPHVKIQRQEMPCPAECASFSNNRRVDLACLERAEWAEMPDALSVRQKSCPSPTFSGG